MPGDGRGGGGACGRACAWAVCESGTDRRVLHGISFLATPNNVGECVMVGWLPVPRNLRRRKRWRCVRTGVGRGASERAAVRAQEPDA